MGNAESTRSRILWSTVVGVWALSPVYQVWDSVFGPFANIYLSYAFLSLLIFAATFAMKMILTLGAIGPPSPNRWTVIVFLFGGFLYANHLVLGALLEPPLNAMVRHKYELINVANLCAAGLFLYVIGAYTGWRIGPPDVERQSFTIAEIFVITTIAALVIASKSWVDITNLSKPFFCLGQLTMPYVTIRLATALVAVCAARSRRFLDVLPLAALIPPAITLLLVAIDEEQSGLFAYVSTLVIAAFIFIPDLLADAMVFVVFRALRSAGWEIQVAKRGTRQTEDTGVDPFVDAS